MQISGHLLNYFIQTNYQYINTVHIIAIFFRLLETELQRVQKQSEHREKEMRQQITELKTDNDRQQKLIGQVGQNGRGL